MANDVHRCLLLLRAREGSSRADMRIALEAAARLTQQKHSKTVTVRTVMEVENDPLGQGFSVAPFDAALDLRTAHGQRALLGAIEELGTQLTATFDAARSTAVAGIEHTVDPGDGELGLFF